MKVLAAGLCALVVSSCTSSLPAEPPNEAVAASDQLIVPGSRIGEYVVGRDTLTDILGQDTPEARKAFADCGLYFEFNKGSALSGVVITCPEYTTPEGLRVGSSWPDVTAALGPAPSVKARNVEGKYYVPVLAYPGIEFMIENCRDVVAVRVGHE